MTVWSSPELARVLGGPVGGVTRSDLESLVDDAAEESEVLDFKTDYRPHTNPKSGWTDKQEFAKDVAAFANARGGVIILGVKDVSGVATGLVPLTSSTPELRVRDLHVTLRNHLSPLPEVQIRAVLDPSGGYFVLVVVPPSDDAPHAVTTPPREERRAFWFPQRRGADTTWLREYEIASLFRQRFATTDDRLRDQRSRVSDSLGALSGRAGIWFWVAAFPDHPVAGVLDNATLRDINTWWDGGEETPLGRRFGRGAVVAGPGKGTFPDYVRRGDTDLDPRFRYTEFHVDGAAFAASALEVLTHDEEAPAKYVGEFTLVDEAVAAVDATLRWAERTVGSWGTATVSFGLRDGGSDAREVQLVADDTDGLLQVALTRRYAPPVDLRGETVADLAAVGSTQDRLVVCHRVLSGVLQWFGRAEPEQISADGSVVRRQWRNRDIPQVERWALARGVSIV